MTQYEKMTLTPIPKLVVTLSIPTIITMLVTSFYNLVDTAFVGQLGTSASGAVGVVFGFMSILQAIGFMFGQGAGSITARLLGQKNAKEASVTASTGFFWALFIGAFTAAICFIFIDPLIRVLGSTGTIAPYARTYITYILIAAPFTVSSFTLNNLLRYEGKAALGMIGMITGAILNMAGDPLLMFTLKMGIAGAGLSTAISQIVGFFILLSMFLRGKTSVKLSLKSCSFKPGQLLNIAGTGMPSVLRQGLNSVTAIMLNNCAGVYGDAAVAAMSIVTRITFFIVSIAIGVGQGLQPVSAFNFGAGKYSRVKAAIRFTIILSEILMVIIVIIVLLFSNDLIRLFRDDPEVIDIGTRALKLYCLSIILLPLCMVTEMLYQSTGHKLGASIMSLLRSGLLFIPALLILSQLRGLAGIQEAQPLAYILSVFPSLWFLHVFINKLPGEDCGD